MESSSGRQTEQHIIDQIRRLRRQKYSVREISRISGKSTSTVLKYMDWKPPQVEPEPPKDTKPKPKRP